MGKTTRKVVQNDGLGKSLSRKNNEEKYRRRQFIDFLDEDMTDEDMFDDGQDIEVDDDTLNKYLTK